MTIHLLEKAYGVSTLWPADPPNDVPEPDDQGQGAACQAAAGGAP